MTDMLVVRGSGEVVKVLLDKQDYRLGMFKSEALAAKAAAAGRASLFSHAVESRHPVEEAHVEG